MRKFNILLGCCALMGGVMYAAAPARVPLPQKIVRQIRKGTVNVPAMVEQYGINAYSGKEPGNTALMFAVVAGQSDIVRQLLEYPDIDVNIQRGTYTPLMEAVINKHSLIETMLRNDSRINLEIKNRDQKTADDLKEPGTEQKLTSKGRVAKLRKSGPIA